MEENELYKEIYRLKAENSLLGDWCNTLHENNAELLEALKGVLEVSRGTSGRIILEVHQEERIKKAIAKAEATK
jgi:hypothetical protein